MYKRKASDIKPIIIKELQNLSKVTRILSSLPEWNLSSFSLKYISTHCSSKSWSFFWSSSVKKSSKEKKGKKITEDSQDAKL